MTGEVLSSACFDGSHPDCTGWGGRGRDGDRLACTCDCHIPAPAKPYRRSTHRTKPKRKR